MFIADFHIHSRYSRATSRDCVPQVLELSARKKGLSLIGTGDFTHPAWRKELSEKLEEAEEGLYRLKDKYVQTPQMATQGHGNEKEAPRFVVTGEISSIYKKNGKVRKVHNLILLPSLREAEALSQKLEAIGNLHSDGRPILGLDSRDLLEITLEVCSQALFIPAHIWTPHFSLFGAYSGFDAIEECFGDLTPHIHALETGLSSDPTMNWRLSALDRFAMISNSDAHSPSNLAREANLFDTALSYTHVARALKDRDNGGFLGTVEFFPEEGKYHYDGHRNCKVSFKPSQTREAQGVCPVCGGRLTVGVLHRAEALADRPEGFVPQKPRTFESLVPLREVVAASLGLTTAGKKVEQKYDILISEVGNELFILREASLGTLEQKAGSLIAEGVRRLREGKVHIEPGYDGEYGKIKLFDKSEIGLYQGQMFLFSEEKTEAGKTVPEEAQKVSPEAAQKAAQKAGKEAIQEAAKESCATDEKRYGGSKINRAEGLNPDKAAGLETAPHFEKALNPDAEQAQEAAVALPMGLNARQWEAVSSRNKAVAVIAGPGTGKTKTLVSRILYLLEEQKVPPARITAVTFTHKAAEEMSKRLSEQLGKKKAAMAKGVSIGTFHSLCLDFLKKAGEKEGSPGPIAVLNEYDALALVEDVLREKGLKTSPRDALKAISLKKTGQKPRAGEGQTELPAGVYEGYCDKLESYGVLDYDDILLRALELFQKPPREGHGVDEERISSFGHVLVDEFQDINRVQYELVKAWGSRNEGLFVIGDPDQAIYGFRGADSRCFQAFLSDYPQALKIGLTQNYRSTPEILSCARNIILKNEEKESRPVLEAQRGKGARIRLLKADSEFSEALFIAKEINRMVGGMDMLEAHAARKMDKKRVKESIAKGFSDIAVLYRTNRQAEKLEQCLSKEGIPYTVTGKEDFLSSTRVREAVAFFRLLHNPGDLLALQLCLNRFTRSTPGNYGGILEAYRGVDKSMEALLTLLKETDKEACEGLNDLSLLVYKYRDLISREAPAALLKMWAEDRGLGEDKEIAWFYAMALLHKTMEHLLKTLQTGQDGDLARSGGKLYRPDAVSLMTFHGAKGLEFPSVFLYGVKDGFLPLKSVRGSNDPKEERRLFYVGLTRARDELLLMTSGEPSPFLQDIGEDEISREAFQSRPDDAAEQLSLF